ncbi:MAG: tetratricopeptide repeat protein [Chitinophagaceae bacterium]|nr:tetratricopeptide repeat protein [Chitinophagaceae bacterium]
MRGQEKIVISYYLVPFFAFLVALNASCNQVDKAPGQQVKALLAQVNTLPENSREQMDFLDSAFHHIKYPGTEDWLEFYGFKCAFYQRQRNFEEAFKYADSMLDLTANKINQVKFAKWYASTLASKGDIYLAVQNYDESFVCYTRSRVIAEKTFTDSCSTHSYTQRLASLMYKQKDFNAAAEYFKLAIKEINCSSVTNEFLTFVYSQANLDNVGLCYAKLHQWDSAVHYFNAAMEYILKQEPKFPTRQQYIQTAKAVVWGNLAGYYAQKNNRTEAESLYIKSLAVFERRNDNFAQNLQLELADMLTFTGRLDEAGKWLDKVRDSLGTLPDANNHLKYYQVRADHHLKLSETGEAVAQLKKYISFKDSVDEANKKFTSVNISADMEKRYQKAVNEALTKDIQLKQAYLLAAISIALMIIVISILMRNNYKRSARLQRKLALKNERERISRELHDDLGSSLTCLQIVVNRLSTNPGESSGTILKNISQISGEAIDQMSEIVWMLKDTVGSVNGLMAHLRVYMAEYIQRTDINLSLDFKNNCKEDHHINNIQQRNLLLVVKEIFHNVIKHSKANQFLIGFSCSEKKIRIIAKDNGIGLHEIQNSEGNGINNMKKRISSINGNILFENRGGLQITIDIPAELKEP